MKGELAVLLDNALYDPNTKHNRPPQTTFWCVTNVHQCLSFNSSKNSKG